MLTRLWRYCLFAFFGGVSLVACSWFGGSSQNNYPPREQWEQQPVSYNQQSPGGYRQPAQQGRGYNQQGGQQPRQRPGNAYLLNGRIKEIFLAVSVEDQDGNDVTIILGPESYFEKHGVEVKPDEIVAVSGKRVSPYFLVAKAVTIRRRKILLRNFRSEPLWHQSLGKEDQGSWYTLWNLFGLLP